MNPEILIPLLIFLAPLAYSPGPGNLFFAALGAARGLRATWPALCGYHVATLVVTFAVGMGFQQVKYFGPDVMTALQWAGAAYVLWLSYCLAHSGPMSDSATRPLTAGALSGAILLILNPKAWLILSLLFTQFPGERPSDVAAITLIFTLNNLLAFVVWAIAGQSLSSLFRSETRARRVNLLFAASLACVAFWMLLA